MASDTIKALPRIHCGSCTAEIPAEDVRDVLAAGRAELAREVAGLVELRRLLGPFIDDREVASAIIDHSPGKANQLFLAYECTAKIAAELARALQPESDAPDGREEG